MEVIKTAGGKSTIYCGENTFKRYAQKLTQGKNLFIITDSNVNEIYGELTEKTFNGAPKFVIPAGEKSKNQKTLFAILEKMIQSNITRSSTVIAFGGGVVGDIAGLAAALYMRGVNLIQIPTTLLSQVDSSVGGKTAVDFKGVKNVIGAFYQPKYVIIDPVFLKTLPKREIKCGLGEIIKYAALDKDIFNKLLLNENKLFNLSFLEEITYFCVKFKADVVDKDERESGLRKCLNMGHTTGHAFELFYKKKSHGEFVLIGMYYELYIAARLGIIAHEYKELLQKLIKKVVPNIPAYNDIDRAAKFAVHDKKNQTANNISVIVAKSEGEYKEVKLAVNDYITLIKDCKNNLENKDRTLKLAVIGKDVSKSSSPEMHSFIAKRLDAKISYDKVSILEENFEDKIREVITEYDGFNVTIPFKLSVIPHLKNVVGDAQTFGAVNTVLSSSLCGYNTDGLGFMLMLKNAGVEYFNKSVLLLGAGGAGRSVAKKLIEGGATVYVYDKNEQSVKSLVEETNGVIPLKEITVKSYDIIINATGVGMHKTEGISPVGEDVISLCNVAVDLIYVPEKSKFLQIAEDNGKEIVNGRAMLFYQAYYAECIYLGIAANDDQAKTLFEEYLNQLT
ncbi:MAG: 3-dehydroquinate synthase [Clostridia bacterium]|nr:3-dehydroquinate synthase [Clostridia bacterium]